MKILIIQEAGRHEKNKNFRESLCIQRALTNLGYESIVWGLNYPSYNIPFSELEKECDVILLLENYPVNNWLPDLSKSNKLKIFWSIDSHITLDNHLYICNTNKINIVLNSVYGHDVYFKNYKTYYFPNAYSDELIYPLNVNKIYDVGFCGSYSNRYEWVSGISNIFNMKIDEFVIGTDMVNAINSYKIHFNRNVGSDVNYRTFETLGCNTFLLTNITPGLDILFDDGNHLVTYTTQDDLYDKIRYYLNNDTERITISKNGYNHVLENHTYTKRMKTLIDIINEQYK